MMMMIVTTLQMYNIKEPNVSPAEALHTSIPATENMYPINIRETAWQDSANTLLISVNLAYRVSLLTYSFLVSLLANQNSLLLFRISQSCDLKKKSDRL
jgi:hypothetical protein